MQPFIVFELKLECEGVAHTCINGQREKHDINRPLPVVTWNFAFRLLGGRNLKD